MDAERGRFDRADRLLGCLLWKPLLFLLVLATAGSAWAGVTILRDTTGSDRWFGALLAGVAVLVFGAGAVGTARKRRISEIDP